MCISQLIYHLFSQALLNSRREIGFFLHFQRLALLNGPNTLNASSSLCGCVWLTERQNPLVIKNFQVGHTVITNSSSCWCACLFRHWGIFYLASSVYFKKRSVEQQPAHFCQILFVPFKHYLTDVVGTHSHHPEEILLASHLKWNAQWSVSEREIILTYIS